MRELTYLLPIRRSTFNPTEIAEIRDYVETLRPAVGEILIVDGSPREVFQAHASVWGPVARHVRADNRYGYLNGKVNGIHTGLAVSEYDKTVVADDDIRFTPGDIARMDEALDRWEVVRPQNYLGFAPAAPHQLPWWALLEAGRMLMNRGWLKTGDYPGTCGFRKSTFRRVGPYDGDVLFDNEEIIRHFASSGASVFYATDFFILKRPPTLKKWWEQRPRQAYEDFVMRFKTALSLVLIPSLILSLAIGHPAVFAAILLTMAALSWIIAARGRRGRAADFFSRSAVLAAPVWVLERAASVWVAVYWRLLHGGYPFGDKVLSKGTGRDWLAGGRST
jgi:hypothetical protein